VCPGLPSGATCTHTSPEQETLLLSVSDIYITTFGGRIGKPLQIQLQCAHYKTVNGITTAQAGVASLTPQSVNGAFDASSMAGILSSDTAATWKKDPHSLAFMHFSGSFITTHVTTHFTVRGTEIVDNTRNTSIAGRMTVTVTGTLLNATYSNGTFHETANSQGSITCATSPIPWKAGEGWGAFTQVVSSP
jgi:hypothetical protein